MFTTGRLLFKILSLFLFLSFSAAPQAVAVMAPGFFAKTIPGQTSQLYTLPKRSAKAKATILPGMFVKVFEKKSDFYALEVAKGKRLWILKKNLLVYPQGQIHLKKVAFSKPVVTYAEVIEIPTPRILASETISHAPDWEAEVGRCLLPDRLESKMAKEFARGVGYQNFVDQNNRLIKKTMRLGLSHKSKLAFDQFFIFGPHGWLRWSAHNKALLKSTPDIQEIVQVDALARTLWAEMEDAAFSDGEHYFEAVARVILNRAHEIEGNTAYRSVFDDRHHPFAYSKWDKPVLRAVRSAKQFSCWNNATPDRKKVYHSLLRTLCPKVGMNPQTEKLWRMAVDISKAAILQKPEFMARTEHWAGNFYYTSQGVSLCSAKVPCGLMRDAASSKAGRQRIKPKYLTFWKVKKRGKVKRG